MAVDEELADVVDDAAARLEDLSHEGVHNAVQVALPVPCLLQDRVSQLAEILLELRAKLLQV